MSSSDAPTGFSLYDGIATGSAHARGALQSGGIECWGIDDGSINDQGQVTNAPTGNSDYTSITSNDDHTCAIRLVDRTIDCWGDDSCQQASGPTGSAPYEQVSAGYRHTCAVAETTRSLQCWGDDTYNQATPPPTGSYREVHAGKFHTCALGQTSGALRCWGINDGSAEDYGQVKQATHYDQIAFQSLTAGAYHSCGIAGSRPGRVYCWGIDDGSDDDYGQVTDTPTASNFIHVSAGAYHTCAITDFGRTVCWGSNKSGQGTPYTDTPFIQGCSPPSPTGYSATDDDCDDSDSSTYPGADESWAMVDRNCDGIIDNPGTSFIDVDEDGSYDDVDCDDNDPTTYPGAMELCDGKWNDATTISTARHLHPTTKSIMTVIRSSNARLKTRDGSPPAAR